MFTREYVYKGASFYILQRESWEGGPEVSGRLLLASLPSKLGNASGCFILKSAKKLSGFMGVIRPRLGNMRLFCLSR